jgi:SAM-dependent methyltransferase
LGKRAPLPFKGSRVTSEALRTARQLQAAHPGPSVRSGKHNKLALAFGIRSDELVLDVGCGAQPFPLATHLVDRSRNDHSERFGMPVPLDKRPFSECVVTSLPYRTKTFDFVYCAHVLEHVADPAQACRELMRVAKRGYIECPRSWFEFACSSNEHRWLVDHEGDVLIFREKLAEENQDILGMRATMLARLGDPRFAQYWNTPAIRAVRSVQFSWTGAFTVQVLTQRERRQGCSAESRAAWAALWRRSRYLNARQELAAAITRAYAPMPRDHT